MCLVDDRIARVIKFFRAAGYKYFSSVACWLASFYNSKGDVDFQWEAMLSFVTDCILYTVC